MDTRYFISVDDFRKDPKHHKFLLYVLDCYRKIPKNTRPSMYEEHLVRIYAEHGMLMRVGHGVYFNSHQDYMWFLLEWS